MLESINKIRLTEAKEEYENNGFTLLDSILLTEPLSKISAAIKDLSASNNIDSYKDRNGLVRRMENFTYKNKVLGELNEEVRELLHYLTNEVQVLFKDKVNFKPPKGEGFFAHYDGVFQFKNSVGDIRNGWYEYANDYNNILITLDEFTNENGPLEVANSHVGNFDQLLKNTNCDGTPNLKTEVEDRCNFTPMICGAGSIIIFKHSCPHRSSVNNSQKERGSLYLTYTPSGNEKIYEQYFKDKTDSQNKNKALTGSLK